MVDGISVASAALVTVHVARCDAVDAVQLTMLRQSLRN